MLLLKALRLLLLLAGLYGWLRLASRRAAPEFAPLLVAAGLSCALLAGGILNLLPHTAWVLVLAGAALAVRSVRKKQSPAALFCPGLAFFAVMAVYFCSLLYGGKVNFWDDYSHWGTVVRAMLWTNRLPNFSDLTVTFTAYPVGHSLLLYFLGYISGIHAEYLWLIGQAWLLLCAVTPLFAFTRGARRGGVQLLTALCSLLLMAGNIRFDNLPVDTLLPLTGLGAFAFCLYYRDELNARLPELALLAIYVMNIKNSGILFSLLLALYVLLHTAGDRWGRWRCAGALLLAEGAAYLLWHRHVRLVFADGDRLWHAMSLSNYLYTFSHKTPQDVAAILQQCAGKLFMTGNRAWLLLALLLLLEVLGRKLRITPRYALSAWWGVGIYAAYMVGLTGMYLFSMSSFEAVQIFSFDRYHQSILQFLCGLLLLKLLSCLEAWPGMARWMAGAALTAAVWISLLPYDYYYGQPFEVPGPPYLIHYSRAEIDAATAFRNDIDGRISACGIPCEPTLSYFVIADTSNSDYAGYLRAAMTYELHTRTVTLLDPAELPERGAEWVDCDLLLNLSQQPEAAVWLQDVFGAAGPWLDLSLYR